MPGKLVAVVAAIAMTVSGSATAGTEQAPEFEDAAHDTTHPGQWPTTDIVAGWIEKETATDFTTVIKLATLDANLALMTGFTFSFQYRGLDYATFAFIFPGRPPDYSYGHLNREGGFLYDSNATTGSIAPGTPGYVRVVFKKEHFASAPHGNGAVRPYAEPPTFDRLGAATLDGKAFTPVFLLFVAGVDPFELVPALNSPPEILYLADRAEGSKKYVMSLGAPDAPPPLADEETVEPLNASAEETESEKPLVAAEPAQTPGPGLLAAVAALAMALARRRRR